MAIRLRNVAIIAHVDHGKTTLVDAMFRQSGVFRANQRVEERVLDSGDLERERGITILAKNTAVTYRGVRINIVDTPGHADFGGEVERTLAMVDGVLLVVDATEGPMPQTRYVLRKALERRLRPVLVINKVDRADARPRQVLDDVYALIIDLGGAEADLDAPVVYTRAKAGLASRDPDHPGTGMEPLFDAILEAVPAPDVSADGPLQMLVASFEADPYQGRLAIGRVQRGTVAPGDAVAVVQPSGEVLRGRVGRVYVHEGLERVAVECAPAGEIVALTGLPEAEIGATVTDPEVPAPLPAIRVDEPTLTMTFRVNDSPFAGREGQYVTSRHLAERLAREVERNVALRVEPGETPDRFLVSGRGELHLAVLIETMRREGYELAVSRPEPIYRRDASGALLEPVEELTVECLEGQSGTVIERVGARRGLLLDMRPGGQGSVRLTFDIPARGLIGLREELLTATGGYAQVHHVYLGHAPHRGPIAGRTRGSLIASEDGEVTAYALHALEDRGTFFVLPQTPVYRGMVVGEHVRENDIEVNVCKAKHVTNVRSSTQEQTVRLSPPRLLTLEQGIEFLAPDELLEVTPKSLRVRKAELDPHRRHRLAKARQAGGS
ncbi:MAG: translational GTPase TypA [Firmicutes bacterium]|nr:translational GTPase TypA [Bacillota bacterium]